MGVTFTYNAELGKHFDVETLFEDGYEAVFLGIGAHESLKLRVKGEEQLGVWGAVEFLREFNLGKEVKIGKKVAVIGGGNAAIDAARTAKRLGAEVTIVYRRTRAEMPADAAEVDAALDEGIKLEYLAAPVEILGDGKVTGMRCIKMELGEPDDSGRRRPVAVEGSEYDTEYDMIIPSISQQPVAACIDTIPEKVKDEWRTTHEAAARPPKAGTLEGAAEIELTKWNTFAVEEVTGAVNTRGVFAGGDAVTGPGMVTDAMGTARTAAWAICDFLGIEAVVPKPSSLPEVDHDEVPIDDYDKTPRAATPHIEVKSREANFDEVELVLSEEQAQAEARRCLECGICSECLECVTACKPEAIRHFDVDEVLEIPVGSVVLTGGFEPFDAELKSAYGYGRIPDVVTSMEFERMLSASGPWGGHLQRPSNEEEPIKIAWLQCVGSRDTTVDKGYCSSVCCMYATKQAVIAKEHSAIVEPTIFFMDNRSYGKEFDRYIDRAEKQYGVRYVRSRVDKIDNEDGKPVVRFEYEDGGFGREHFDLVVLSIGLGADAETVELLNKLEIDTDGYGFVAAPDFAPTSTSRPGVYAAGAIAGPKDIPESVTEASAAAAAAGAIVAPSRDTLLAEPVFPEPRDIKGQEPRVGVFICHCGINIGGIVDVPAVVEYAADLPYVVYNEENLFTCSQDTQKLMGEMIQEHNLNRVVVASCTPRTHEPLFRETLKESGLNPYLFEMANIREHCSWVHMDQKEEATEKAKELMQMAVARCVNLEPLADIELPVTQSALVIGGGVAGMTAAAAIAESGFPVTLVEREERLGGNLLHIHYTIDGKDTAPLLKELEEKVRGNENISVYTGAEIESVNGFVGNFAGVINNGGGTTELEVGAVVVATGGSEAEQKEFALGESDRVMTQRELEAGLAGGKIPHDAKSVAMIHCVGSRDEEHYYCSRTCCAETVKNALKVKELNPEAEVYCFYRDMRTYGEAEDYYRTAREKGVIFVRFDPERKPAISPNGKKLTVNFYDFIVGDDVEVEVDLLALAEGAWPDVEGNKRLAEMLKVPLTADGFYLEAHMKLRPVDFATEGVFVCGLAHGPKTVEESISQAQAAAARAITILAKDTITAEGRVAGVDENRCIGCGTCVSICPYIAIELDMEKGVAVVNEGLCKGCGSCAAACWSAAIDIAGVSNEQLLEAITAL
jgi:heterodisulfide reductase subunit A-like polyferredoxin